MQVCIKCKEDAIRPGSVYCFVASLGPSTAFLFLFRFVQNITQHLFQKDKKYFNQTDVKFYLLYLKLRPLSSMENLPYGLPVFCPFFISLAVLK